MKHFKLGASIYVPATRDDISLIASGNKIRAKSVIFCTEDSVNESMLKNMNKSEKMMRFIRVRNTEVLSTVLKMNSIEKIDGFVFPKVTASNFEKYTSEFDKNGHSENNFNIMPTLETKEVFNGKEMENLCDIFLKKEYKEKILSLRIGGNDLLNILGIRRSRYRTIYESPLGVTIANLVTIFKSQGFNLTSPVCEFLHDTELLKKELPRDLEYGLFGKTAIHPDQIQIIENSYMPSEQDVEMATAILSENAPAVFGMHGTMCEKATHSNWAKEIIIRSEVYGTFGVLKK